MPAREAAVDLARLAGMASGACASSSTLGRRCAFQCRAADEHGLVMISIADLIRYRRRTESQVTRVAQTRLPTAFGDFTAFGYRSETDDSEHIALVAGEIGDGEESRRVHSGTDRGRVRIPALRLAWLQAPLLRVAAEGRGVVLVKEPRGRGIGLLLARAYACGRRARRSANSTSGSPPTRGLCTGARIRPRHPQHACLSTIR
jgi:3,4-dihydroxy 2-butanone 4-phosphate synthase/GTP cyclohydrolase II